MKAIISSQIRVRHPESFKIGEDSIVDDFSYFSTRVEVGRGSHIANNCTVGGGGDRLFKLGDFCSLSAGVRIWCASDDFVNDVVAITPKDIGEVKQNLIVGDVIVGNYCAIGSNTVVMPGVQIPEGTVIGAMSFVPAFYELKPWTVYAGNPIREIRPRNRKMVEEQVQKLLAYFEKK